MPSNRTILHPTDFSECSRHAFQVAGTLAREQAARLVILHVKEPLYGFAPYDGILIPIQPAEDAEWLRDALHRYEVNDGVRVEYRLEEGEPVRIILRVAVEIGCDLIVMGTHGRTGLERLLLGSVAEQVLRKAPCPVLTLKAPNGLPAASPPLRPGFRAVSPLVKVC